MREDINYEISCNVKYLEVETLNASQEETNKSRKETDHWTNMVRAQQAENQETGVQSFQHLEGVL